MSATENGRDVTSGFFPLAFEVLCQVCPLDYKDAMRLWCTCKKIQTSLRRTRVQVELDNTFDTHRFMEHEQGTIARMQTWASFTMIAISDSYELAMEDAAARGKAGVWWLEGVLEQCSALVNLDLSNNYIQEDGAGKLGRVLRQCQALKHLDLSTNMIMDDGVEMLAGVLAHCGALTSVNLRNNCISDQGAATLAGVVGKCKRLTHLDLSDNCIGDDGAGRLAGVVKECHKLVEMNLTYNEIGDGMQHELEQLTQVYV